MGSYAQNMYKWLKKKGYSQKYEHPGIYCIKVNGKIAYIGKSHNMLRRVAEHYVGIKTQSEKKYRILAEIQRKGYSVDFDVLYDAKSTQYGEIMQEIGGKEGEYIRKYHPPLNTQIPKEEDWQKWDLVEINPQSVISLLLDEQYIYKKEKRKKNYEAKKKDNTEKENYYLGFLHALEWVRGKREYGVEDLHL